MRSIFKLSIFITMAAILFGCSSSDSGSSTPPPPTTKSLNGVVIDPPVTGARVVLWGEIDGSYQPANFCGAGKNTICNTYTNNEGRFSIIYDLSKDISNFYLVTHGGTDTLYNTDLTGISLYSPLALFDVEKDIIVSPITTVVNSLIVNEGVSLSDAVQNTANALNISEDLVAVSPLESAELLKASYLVVKAAEFIHNESVEDPLTKIAAAVKEEPTLTIADDGFLNKLFELSDITESETITALKGEIQDLSSLLESITDPGDTTALAEQIITEESRLVFADAIKDAVDNMAPTPDALFDANAANLYNTLSSLLGEGGRLPTNQFAASQLVRYIIDKDDFFGDYDNYLDSSFQTQLDALAPSDEGEKAEFAANIAAISRESIYFVNAPLSIPLENNNSARVDYYFKSNADVSYKARDILKNVRDDAINDSIADEVIDSYSIHGFPERALEIANYYIRATANRITGIRSIGYWTKDRQSALKYTDIGKNLLDAEFNGKKDSIFSNSTNFGSFIGYYTQYMRNYDRAGDHTKADSIRTFLLSEMLPYFKTPTISATALDTRWNNILNSFGSLNPSQGLIIQLIAEGDVETALHFNDYYVNLTQNGLLIANANGMTAANLYKRQINHSANAAVLYRLLANSYNPALMKTKIAGIKEFIDSIIDNRAATDGGRNTLPYLIGPVYWASGKTAAESVVSMVAQQQTSYLLQAYYEMALAIAEDDEAGFADAVDYYESKNNILSDYSNLNSIVNAFAYTNNWQLGIGAGGYRHGRSDITENAANYLVDVLDSAKTYFEGLGGAALANNANIMIAAADNIYPEGSAYPIGSEATSSDDYDKGYVKAATLYTLAENPVKAIEVLKKAESYVEAAFAATAYTQGQYYSLLGYYYLKLASSTSDSAAAYQKAADLLSSIATDDNKLKYNLLLAYNSYYNPSLSIDGKKSAIDGYMSSATSLAENIYTSGSGDTELELAKSEIDYFIKIAERYASVNDLNKVKLSLEKAEATADILWADKAAKQGEVYTAYAKLYSVDIAVKKANEMASTEGRDAVLKDIAAQVASTDKFPASGLASIVSYNEDTAKIAFSDTDNDGKPDFFVPWATAEQILASGLALDDDIDGDGKLDTVDLTPFFAD